MLKQLWKSVREAMALDECRYSVEETDELSDEFEDLPLQRRMQLCADDNLIFWPKAGSAPLAGGK